MATGRTASPLPEHFTSSSDPQLFKLRVLVDAIRSGPAREREFAIADFHKPLGVTRAQEEEMTMSDDDRLVIGQTIMVSRAALGTLAQQFHIRRLVLFGSATSGELKPESDIDLMIEFESGRGPSLGGMVEIQDAFSKLFGGRKVDVATPSILNNPYRRRAIEKNMEVLYAA